MDGSRSLKVVEVNSSGSTFYQCLIVFVAVNGTVVGIYI